LCAGHGSTEKASAAVDVPVLDYQGARLPISPPACLQAQAQPKGCCYTTQAPLPHTCGVAPGYCALNGTGSGNSPPTETGYSSGWGIASAFSADPGDAKLLIS